MTDWDDAFDNINHVPNALDYFDTWQSLAKAFRESGVHDLRNLLKTTLNDTLNLTPAEAASESPCLHTPVTGANITCWAGSIELPEFIWQNQLL